jgi:hypothetical protein
MITGSGAEVTWQTPGRWSVSVRIGDAERSVEADHGKSFRAAKLRAWSGGWRGEVDYQVAGPNIRADGSDGKRRQYRVVTAERAWLSWPAAMAELVKGAAELAELITADAASALAAVNRVGEGGEVK